MLINNSPQTWFQFSGKAITKLSDSVVEKVFKAIRNVLQKYDVVISDFIFGQTTSWK